MTNFAYEISLSYLYGSLTCHKILRRGADSFTSPPKEGVLPLKIHSPRLGFNWQTLGPMASTLTIRSPRKTSPLLLPTEGQDTRHDRHVTSLVERNRMLMRCLLNHRCSSHGHVVAGSTAYSKCSYRELSIVSIPFCEQMSSSMDQRIARPFPLHEYGDGSRNLAHFYNLYFEYGQCPRNLHSRMQDHCHRPQESHDSFVLLYIQRNVSHYIQNNDTVLRDLQICKYAIDQRSAKWGGGGVRAPYRVRVMFHGGVGRK
jgi:hypothetical protein